MLFLCIHYVERKKEKWEITHRYDGTYLAKDVLALNLLPSAGQNPTTDIWHKYEQNKL